MSASNATNSPGRIRRSLLFLEPGIRAVAGGEHPRVDPFSAHRDIGLIENGEKLVLRQAGPERLAHARHGDIGDRQRVVHAEDLFGRLDRASALKRLLRVDELDAAACKRRCAPHIAAVDRETLVAARRRVKERGELRGPAVDALGKARAAEKITERLGGPQLRDGFKAARHFVARHGIEQHDRALGRHEEISSRRVRLEHGVVPAAGGVAHVDGIDQQAARAIPRLELLAHAAQAVAPQPRHIERRGRIGDGDDGCLMRYGGQVLAGHEDPRPGKTTRRIPAPRGGSTQDERR